MTPASDPQTDARWMRAALSLAARGLGRVWPNPAVGCVIVKDGRPVGRGWTQPGGRPHAETEALGRAGSAARGATVYVTLEPCSHHGVTPPCAEALVDAGVIRVVVASPDPDARVSGRGLARLREAGIDVVEGVLAADAAGLNRGFVLNRTENRPLVVLKLATTLDGKIATATGESQWITGKAARTRAHLLRATHDAVAVGAGTAEADNPSLTVRLPGQVSGQGPIRVLIGSRSLRRDAKLAQPALGRTIRIAPYGADGQDDGIETRFVPVGDDGRPAPEAVLSALAGIGITRLLVEGGGQVAASFLRAGLVDELAWFRAGAVLGEGARPGIGALAIERLNEMPRFELQSSERIGGDTLEVWHRPTA